jgi:Tfp pilus assembly protein PilV
VLTIVISLFSNGGGQRGYTFHEVLLTMGVISIGLLSYSVGTFNVIRRNSDSRDYTVAVNLAQDKLEQLKGQKNLANMNKCPMAGERNIDASGEAGGVYNRCWVIADSAMGAKLKQITVSVSWADGQHREVSFTTLVYSN